MRSRFRVGTLKLVSLVVKWLFRVRTAAVAAVHDERACLHAIPDVLAGAAAF
jgi:hypothetical protein